MAVALARPDPLPEADSGQSPALRQVSELAGLTALRATESAAALALTEDLAGLVPGGFLKPGSSVGVIGGAGQTSVLLRLLAGPMSRGCWAAAIGLPALGAQAAVEFGVRLDHLALIPDPGADWLEVTAALLDSVDLVVLSPPQQCRPADARRLLARARQRQSVLIVTDAARDSRLTGSPPRRIWPEPPDVIFTATESRWQGLAEGHGALRSCRITVTASGRRLAGRGRTASVTAQAEPDQRLAG